MAMMFLKSKRAPWQGRGGTNMTQKKDSAKEVDWREVFGRGPDGLRALVQQVVQELLEAEMDEAVRAEK